MAPCTHTSARAAGTYKRERVILTPQGTTIRVSDGKPVLNLCANNYLGLANHPDIVNAARKSVDTMGVGPAAVRSIAGTMTLHVELEKRLAQFKGVEAAITFQSGFTANLGAISALVAKEDVIFSDRLNHASIIDGCRLSGAKIIPYEHNDPGSLEDAIKEHASNFRRALIITDGVFSMDGDIAPLPAIYEVTKKYDLLLMVDDAHGIGVLGPTGRGTPEHFGLEAEIGYPAFIKPEVSSGSSGISLKSRVTNAQEVMDRVAVLLGGAGLGGGGTAQGLGRGAGAVLDDVAHHRGQHARVLAGQRREVQAQVLAHEW